MKTSKGAYPMMEPLSQIKELPEMSDTEFGILRFVNTDT